MIWRLEPKDKTLQLGFVMEFKTCLDCTPDNSLTTTPAQQGTAADSRQAVSHRVGSNAACKQGHRFGLCRLAGKDRSPLPTLS